MPAKVETYDMGIVPQEQLGLFELTHSITVPWRNPVSYWVPTNRDIKAIGALAKSVAINPVVVDIGCGNAFISHLLAEEVPVIGIDPNEELLVKTPYKHPNLALINGNAEQVNQILDGRPSDVVISSWMPERINLSDGIYALNPKAIIFVREGWGFTGTREAYERKDGYRQVACWLGFTTADVSIFFDELCEGLEPYKPKKYYSVDEAKAHKRWGVVFERGINRVISGIRALNIFDVRFRDDIQSPNFPIQVNGLSPYPWEVDLQHILSNTFIRKSYSDEDLLVEPPVIANR